MALPMRGDPGLTFVGFLLLAALGAAYWKSAPLESARPQTDETPYYDSGQAYTVDARLWQDPFKAVYTQCGAALDPNSDSTGPSPDGRQCSSAFPGEKAVASPSWEGKEVLLLPVMVWPGAHAEVEERRRRMRYAVSSALSEAGFAPKDAERLYFWIRTDDPDAAPGRSPDPAISGCRSGADCAPSSGLPGPRLIPYEWYERDQHADPGARRLPDSVVVVWVDDQKLGDTPIASLMALLDSPPFGGGAESGPRVSVIGPARSGTLRRMVQEVTREDESPSGYARFVGDPGLGGRVAIFSPNATVSAMELLGEAEPAGCAGVHQLEMLFENCSRESYGGIDFLRSIRDDRTLLEALVAELERRGIDVEADSEGDAADHIAVISEWDTYYGRSLPKNLAAIICGANSCDHVHEYSYQRGIDGIVPGAQKNAVGSSGKDRAARGEPSLEVVGRSTQVRRAVGPGQYDYIRRLAGRIRDRNEELRLSEGRSIRAVFILGSDVYDKLLILRALRPQLPGTVWLTTDYDSLLLHPEDFRWARNLVIASTYGSRLPLALQARTPPFRSTYQTSAYLSVRMAVDPGFLESLGYEAGPEGSSEAEGRQDWLNRHLPARLFEVGRWGAVPLGTGRSGGDAAVAAPPQGQEAGADPLNAESSGRGGAVVPGAVGLFLIAVLGLFALHQLRARSGPQLVWAAVLVGFMTLLTVIAIRSAPEGEPLLFHAGVSVWPTEYLRILILMTSVAFVWTSVQQLDRNARRIEADYFGGEPVAPFRGKTLLDVFDRIFRIRTPRIPRWTRLVLIAFAIVIAFPMVLGRISQDVLDRVLWLGGLWAVVIGTWWYWIHEKRVGVGSINAWIEDPARAREVNALWRDYRLLGEPRHWFVRSASYLLLYMAFASFVFTLLGTSHTPCRGALVCFLDRALLGLSVLATLFLLFVAVDAIRLCLAWIKLVGDEGTGWAELVQSREGTELPPRHLELMYKIQLIGDRTAAVSKLVYYPVLILLLMLLAKSTYFDDWSFPQALAIVVGVNFLIAFASALRLNQVAERVRDRIVDRLQKEQLQLVATEDGKATQPVETAAEVGELIARIRDLQVGAFRKPWDQPIVRAGLLFLGGVGISYSEYASFL